LNASGACCRCLRAGTGCQGRHCGRASGAARQSTRPCTLPAAAPMGIQCMSACTGRCDPRDSFSYQRRGHFVSLISRSAGACVQRHEVPAADCEPRLSISLPVVRSTSAGGVELFKLERGPGRPPPSRARELAPFLAARVSIERPTASLGRATCRVTRWAISRPFGLCVEGELGPRAGGWCTRRG
jgi:hypothetical protein